MKHSRLIFLLPILGLLFLQSPVYAQDSDLAGKEVILERTIEDENGTEIIETVTKRTSDVSALLDGDWIMGDVSLNRTSFTLNIEALKEECLSITIGDYELQSGLDYEVDPETGLVELLNTPLLIEGDDIVVRYEEQGISEVPGELFSSVHIMRFEDDFEWHEAPSEEGRPLLGVYPETRDDGVYINSMVDYCGAVEAGIRAGDRILALDGEPIQTVGELRQIIQSNEPGYVMQVRYEREGEIFEVQSTLCESRNTYETIKRARSAFWNDESSVDDGRPLLGVYPVTREAGVYVTRMVDYCGAVAAGLQEGDIIVALDGKPVQTVSELRSIVQSNEPGYEMRVTYRRDGQEYEVISTLCEQKRFNHVIHDALVEPPAPPAPPAPPVPPQAPEPPAPPAPDFSESSSEAFGLMRATESRSTPKPWIGISMNDGDDDGVMLTKIHDGSPAQEIGLQQGDRVVVLNGAKMESSSDIVHAVSGLNPGDQITIEVDRNGERVIESLELGTWPQFSLAADLDLDFEFDFDDMIKFERKAEPRQIEWSRVHEIVIKEANKAEQLITTLDVQDFSAFPNPTAGNLTISFEGEAGKPIDVILNDASGREIYQTRVPNFDGSFNDQLDITDAIPGPVLITVSQGGRSFTSKVIYTGRP